MANSVSHAALPFPVKGARFTLQVPYLDADGDPTDPTTPDTERSIDGAAFADCTEEVSTISGSNGVGYVTLTGDEMNGSMVAVAAKVASGPKATLATLYPRVLPPLKDHPSGTAQAGAAGTITLASTAPTFDLAGCIVKTTGGTGGGGGSGSQGNQARVITAYNGSTKVATVEPNWETTPDNTTTYAILLTDMFNPSGAADALLDEVLSTTVHNTDGSVGQRVRRSSAIATDGVVNDAGATTTSFIVGGTVTTNDFFNDQVLVFTTGALAGQSKPVLDYDGATKTITLSEALTSAPANGVEFVLIPVHVHPVAQIVEGVWGEALPGAYGAGEAGNILGTNLDGLISDIPNAASNAAAVWDEATAGHVGAGSFGKAVVDIKAKTDNLPADPADASDVAALIAAVQADTNDIQTRLPAALVSGRMDVSVGAMADDVVTAAALAADAGTEIADALLKRDLSAVTGEAARSPLNALRFLRNKWTVALGVLTVFKEDDATTAWTGATTTDAAADPIVGNDPA